MTRYQKTTVAALAALLALAGNAPAQAGGWRHHHAELVVVYEATDVPWYHQSPWVGTGVELYYSHYPHHVPGYPTRLRGLPVPIYDPAPPATTIIAPAHRLHHCHCR